MTTLYPPLEQHEIGPVPKTDDRLRDLWSLVHSQPRLQRAGYVLWPLGQADLDKKKRCGRCTKVIRKGHEKQKSRALSVKLAPTLTQQIVALAREEAEQGGQTTWQSSHARSVSLHTNGSSTTPVIDNMMQGLALDNEGQQQHHHHHTTTGPPLNCKHHPGYIQQRQWSCCGKNISSPPCAAEQFHVTRIYRRGELESNWAYFSTPHSEEPPPFTSSTTPSEHVTAVVIDCEMGTAQSGESELIRVSAIDFFTRAVLVDSLVWPDVKMAHFNTRYSGVSRQGMDAARRARRTLAGRQGARQALWRFVGPRTIVVGHSANSDLTALRWIHPVVIDTLLLEMRIQPPREDERQQQQQQQPPPPQSGDKAEEGGASIGEPVVEEVEEGGVRIREPAAEEAEGSRGRQGEGDEQSLKSERTKYPGLSLKALAAERLRREIQIKGQGHDSLEDALATRDLLLWHLIHKPVPPIVAFD